MKKPIVMDEGEVTFTRWTIRLLCGLCILLVIGMGVSAYKVSDLAHQLEEVKQENGVLKTKLMLLNEPLGDTQRTVDTVTNLIAKLGKKTPEEAERLAILEVLWSRKHNVDLSVGLAVSFQESKWKVKAVSENGYSIGVKQVNLSAHKPEFKGMTLPKLLDPSYNIDVGYALISRHMHKYGSLRAALQRYRGSDKPAVNAQYAEDVLRIAHAFRQHLSFSQT